MNQLYDTQILNLFWFLKLNNQLIIIKHFPHSMITFQHMNGMIRKQLMWVALFKILSHPWVAIELLPDAWAGENISVLVGALVIGVWDDMDIDVLADELTTKVLD